MTFKKFNLRFILTKIFIKKDLPTDEKGQALIEYILLLSVIMSMAYLFNYSASKGLGETWKRMVSTVVSSAGGQPQTLKIR